MKKWLALLMFCLALGLVAAGCGSDDDDDGDSANTAEAPPADTSTTEQPPAEKKGAAAGGTVPVKIVSGNLFKPMDVTVKAGQTVKWTNDDSVPHTVTKASGPGARFDSGTMNGGAVFSRKFDKPGNVGYVCTIHPGQSGTVTVE